MTKTLQQLDYHQSPVLLVTKASPDSKSKIQISNRDKTFSTMTIVIIQAPIIEPITQIFRLLTIGCKTASVAYSLSSTTNCSKWE